MNDTITPILQWINANPGLAGLATFIISAAESVAIIGTVIPGSVMMTAIGALAGAGVMPLWSTIIWAILGAVVGDGISYWVGHYFKDRLHVMWPFRTHPAILARGEAFFNKHGGKSVFIGRFVGPVRALVPLVAGMFGMKPSHFLIANVTSAIFWAPAYMLPGILLGAAALELPPDVATHALLMLIMVVLFIILCIWLLKKLLFLIGQQINQGLTSIWQYLNKYRYFTPITSALKHHEHHKTYGQLTLAFFFIVFAFIFLYLAMHVQAVGSENIFINKLFFHFFRSLRTPLGDSIMIAITTLGEASVLIPVVIALFVWFAYQKRWYTAWHILVLGLLTIISVEALKHLLLSARPWGIFSPPTGYSFPSGHTTLAVAFYLGLAILLTELCQIKYRRTIYTIATLLILAVASSRLYLGSHWFTDVLGGLLLGTTLLMFVILSYNRHAEQLIKAPGVLLVAFITLFMTSTFYYAYNYTRIKTNYSLIDWPSYTVSLNSWWDQKNNHLPLDRVNRFGLSTQILNLQWIGSIDTIKKILIENGWRLPPEQDWVNVLHRISDIKSAEHLPLVSPLYLDKKPVLVLVKNFNTKKMVALRLWDSNLTITQSHDPLWVGTVEVIPRTYGWLFKKTRLSDVTLTPELLFAKNPSSYDIKVLKVENQQKHIPEQPMLLIKPKHI